jgi:hypothetical protein
MLLRNLTEPYSFAERQRDHLVRFRAGIDISRLIRCRHYSPVGSPLSKKIAPANLKCKGERFTMHAASST